MYERRTGIRLSLAVTGHIFLVDESGKGVFPHHFRLPRVNAPLVGHTAVRAITVRRIQF